MPRNVNAHHTPFLAVLAAETFVLPITAEFYHPSPPRTLDQTYTPITTDSQVTGGDAEKKHFLPSMATQTPKEKTHIFSQLATQNRGDAQQQGKSSVNKTQKKTYLSILR